ncbi:MAG: hypothetical protein H7Y07_10830 [Pyrinomonadaceae bacterium]|nr:hypothetical protein [Sphingobacteriaceae bacterium]
MKTYFASIIIIFSCISCQRSVKPEELYGEWKYIKVENPKQQPAYIMPDEEVKLNKPFIKFTPNKDLIIIWGGKRLSYGKFRMENSMIRFKENFADGTSREFPFLIKELSAERIVFETMRQDFTRITAIKVK